jgi:hypothetical protein
MHREDSDRKSLYSSCFCRSHGSCCSHALSSPLLFSVENNPTGIEHPEEFHPDGSNSEQIIAGERSDFDPLAERLKKNGGSFRGKIAMDAHEDPDSVREMSAPLTDIPEDTLHRSGP